jgi:hypothetical protein
MDATGRGLDALRSRRRAAVQEREEFLALQKTLGKAGHHAAAKMMKSEARDLLQEERALTLVIGFHSPEPGPRSTVGWPIEFAEKLDHAFNLYTDAGRS